MNICPDCVKAQTCWHHGGYHAECEACSARGIAMSPKFIRERFYALTLEKEGADRLAEVKALVKKQYQRIQTLKREAEDQ